MAATRVDLRKNVIFDRKYQEGIKFTVRKEKEKRSLYISNWKYFQGTLNVQGSWIPMEYPIW